MKRQRSRNRSGGGGGGGGGGGKPQHNTNRAFDSNGPEGVKVRGAAQGVYEKYQQLARDAQTSGDRVLAENYLQHAEHYFRLMRAMQPQRPIAEIIGRDQFVSGYDIDFEDESGAVADAGEAEAESEAAAEAPETGGDRQPQRFEPRREDYRNLESRGRDDQPRSDRPSGERAGGGDRPTFDRPQGERPPRDDRQRSPREDRPRDDRARDDRPRFQRDDRPARGERVERGERNDRDPLGVVEPEATPLTVLSAGSAPAAEAPMLRADDGEISHAPAFLQVRAVESRAEGGDEPKRPRRRRASTAPTAAPAEAPVSEVEE